MFFSFRETRYNLNNWRILLSNYCKNFLFELKLKNYNQLVEFKMTQNLQWDFSYFFLKFNGDLNNTIRALPFMMWSDFSKKCGEKFNFL